MKAKVMVFFFGAVFGMFVAFVALGYATQGYNTHPTESYIVAHRCSYAGHFYEDGTVVVVRGKQVNTKPMSWDRWDCPSGPAVAVSQEPAVKH